jgi:hypothetical protein
VPELNDEIVFLTSDSISGAPKSLSAPNLHAADPDLGFVVIKNDQDLRLRFVTPTDIQFVDNTGGMVDPEEVRKAITDKTVLISIMFANNEIGTINPMKEIGKIAKEKGILLHCDATQGVGKVPVNVQEMGIDLMSGERFSPPRRLGSA